MTLRYLLENVKGAEYLVIEVKEKELNPFTDKIKKTLTYQCSETEKYK